MKVSHESLSFLIHILSPFNISFFLSILIQPIDGFFTRFFALILDGPSFCVLDIRRLGGWNIITYETAGPGPLLNAVCTFACLQQPSPALYIRTYGDV